MSYENHHDVQRYYAFPNRSWLTVSGYWRQACSQPVACFVLTSSCLLFTRQELSDGKSQGFRACSQLLPPLSQTSLGFLIRTNWGSCRKACIKILWFYTHNVITASYLRKEIKIIHIWDQVRQGTQQPWSHPSQTESGGQMTSFLLIFMFIELWLSSSRSALAQGILDPVSFTENRHFNSVIVQFQRPSQVWVGTAKEVTKRWRTEGKRERFGVGSTSKQWGVWATWSTAT